MRSPEDDISAVEPGHSLASAALSVGDLACAYYSEAPPEEDTIPPATTKQKSIKSATAPSGERPRESPPATTKRPPLRGLPKIPESEDVDFSSRDVAILSIVKQYKDHPHVYRALRPYRNKNVFLGSADDLVNRYLNEAGQFRLLTKADEQMLFAQIERGLEAHKNMTSGSVTDDEEAALLGLAAAHNIVYHTNLKLVISIANEYTASKYLPFLDLIQEGNVGLARAIRWFDYRRGFKFSSSATMWTKNYIKRAIANKGRTIRIPVQVHDERFRLWQFHSQMSFDLGREPTNEEIANAMNIQVERVETLRRVGQRDLLSLEMSVDEDGETELGHIVSYEEDKDIRLGNFMDRDEIHQILSRYADKLPVTQAALVSLLHRIQIDFLNGVEIETPQGLRPYKELLSYFKQRENFTEMMVFDALGLTRYAGARQKKKAYAFLREASQEHLEP